MHYSFVICLKYLFFYIEGSVEIFTNRCMAAILALESDTVFWPEKDERSEIKHRIREESGFPQCIGFIDGTLFPLEYKPLIDGEDYYSRKGSPASFCGVSWQWEN